MLSESDRAVIKGQIVAFLIVKAGASLIVLYYFLSWQAALIIAVLSIPWILGGLYYFGRNGWFRYRFWKHRHLRERLLREEWDVGEDASETVTRDQRRSQ